MEEIPALSKPENGENFHFSWVLQQFNSKTDKLRSPVFLGGSLSQHKWELELNPREKAGDDTELISVLLRMIQRGKNSDDKEIFATVDCILRLNSEFRLKKTTEVSFTTQPQSIKWIWKKRDIFPNREITFDRPLKVICRISLKSHQETMDEMVTSPAPPPPLLSPEIPFQPPISKQIEIMPKNLLQEQTQQLPPRMEVMLPVNGNPEITPTKPEINGHGRYSLPSILQRRGFGTPHSAPSSTFKRGPGRPPGAKNLPKLGPKESPSGGNGPKSIEGSNSSSDGDGGGLNLSPRKRGRPKKYLPEEGVDLDPLPKKINTQPKASVMFDHFILKKTNGEEGVKSDFNLGAMLLKGETFPDGEVIIAERLFRVHKGVLACQSPFFFEIFNKGEKPSLPDLDPTAFEIALNFIYMGSFSSNDDLSPLNLTGILEIAEKCRLERLHEATISRILELAGLDAGIGVKLVELASGGSSEEFLDRVLALVKPIYYEIKKLPKWKEMVQDPRHQRMVQRLVLLLDS